MSDQRRVVVIGSGPAGAMAAARARPPRACRRPCSKSGTRPPAGFLVRAAGRNLFRRATRSAPSDRRVRRRRRPGHRVDLQPGASAGCRTSGPAPCPASPRRTSPRASGCTSATAGRSTTTTSRPSTPRPSGCSTSPAGASDVPALPAGRVALTRDRCPPTGERVAASRPSARPGPHRRCRWPTGRRGCSPAGAPPSTASRSILRPLLGDPLLRAAHRRARPAARVVGRAAARSRRCVYLDRATGRAARLDGGRRRRGLRRAALDQAAVRLGLPRLPRRHRQHRRPARPVPPRPPEGVVELRRPTGR